MQNTVPVWVGMVCFRRFSLNLFCLHVSSLFIFVVVTVAQIDGSKLLGSKANSDELVCTTAEIICKISFLYGERLVFRLYSRAQYSECNVRGFIKNNAQCMNSKSKVGIDRKTTQKGVPLIGAT